MGIRSTFRAASCLTLGLILARICGFFQLVILAHSLSKQGLGDYALCFALAMLLASFSALGIAAAVVRESAKDSKQGSKFVLAGFPTRLTASLVAMCIGIGMAIGLPWRSELRYTAIIFSVTSVAISLAQLNEHLLILQERAAAATLCQVISRVVELALIAAVILSGFGVVAVSLCVMGARVGLCVVTARLVIRRIPAPRRLFVVLSSIYYRLDTVMLSALKGNVEVATYAIAISLVKIAAMFHNPLNKALFPFLTREHAKDPTTLVKAHNTSIKVLTAISLPGAVLGTVLAPVLIPAVYGAGYWGAAGGTQVLVWSLPVLYISMFTMTVLLVGGQQKLLPLSVLAGATANCILNWLFIPGYGYLGAAVATTAARFVTFSVLMYLCCKGVHKVQLVKAAGKPLLATAAMVASLPILCQFGLAVEAVGASSVFLAAFFALRPFTREETNMFRKALGRPPSSS